MSSLDAAGAWLTSLLAGDTHAMWAGLDPAYQRYLGPDVEEARRDLLIGIGDVAGWSWVGPPKTVAGGYELVKLVDGRVAPKGQERGPLLLPAVEFYMRQVGDSWLVASVNEPPSEGATSG